MPVSRAEEKLAGAVRAFSYDFTGKTVLDIGSSTGGFTEYALNHGAKKVIAVEKGTNQMKAPLRFDPRVELHEKTDIFKVTAARALPPAEHKLGRTALSVSVGGNALDASSDVVRIASRVDVILADVSFVSLRKVLSHAKLHLATAQTDFLVMLKPQFEAESSQLARGVVKNEKIRRAIIKDFETWLKQNGFFIQNKRDNDLAGKNGNVERFYLLKLEKTN